MHELKFVEETIEKIKRMKKKEYTIRIPDYHDAEEFKEMLNSFLKERKIKIRVKKVPVRIKCLDCGYEGRVNLPFSMVRIKPRCPNCKSRRTEIIQGKEIEVV